MTKSLLAALPEPPEYFVRLAASWRFFHSTKLCVPLCIEGAVRFFTSGTSLARSVTTKSRIASHPGRAASGFFASGAGSSFHIARPSPSAPAMHTSRCRLRRTRRRGRTGDRPARAGQR